jgi:23S rRNA pseudouridine2605 synthase
MSYKKNPGKSSREVKKPKTVPAISEPQSIRLNKYIAQSGVCSRREADTLIENGKIRVNDKVITEMGYQVQPGDKVYYDKRLLSREKLVYVLLNKPKDFITTTDDPQERKTVMNLVATACEERIYPVGRLDRNTTGLLLLTNDGELSKKLTHPSHEISKMYQVELDMPLSNKHFEDIQEGIELEDGLIKIDDIAVLDNTGRNLGIEIHSGKNRIVRRIFESLGYQVTRLDRVMFAGLTKKDLPRGKWRFLSEKEIIRLKYLK